MKSRQKTQKSKRFESFKRNARALAFSLVLPLVSIFGASGCVSTAPQPVSGCNSAGNFKMINGRPFSIFDNRIAFVSRDPKTCKNEVRSIKFSEKEAKAHFQIAAEWISPSNTQPEKVIIPSAREMEPGSEGCVETRMSNIKIGNMIEGSLIDTNVKNNTILAERPAFWGDRVLYQTDLMFNGESFDTHMRIYDSAKNSSEIFISLASLTGPQPVWGDKLVYCSSELGSLAVRDLVNGRDYAIKDRICAISMPSGYVMNGNKYIAHKHSFSPNISVFTDKGILKKKVSSALRALEAQLLPYDDLLFYSKESGKTFVVAALNLENGKETTITSPQELFDDNCSMPDKEGFFMAMSARFFVYEKTLYVFLKSEFRDENVDAIPRPTFYAVQKFDLDGIKKSLE